jgi:HEAT repeat protein
MKCISCLLLVSLLVGCGSPNKEGKEKSSDKKAEAKDDAARNAKPKYRKPQPTRIEVPADAYSGISAAIDALSKAAESDDSGEILRTCAWLRMQGDAAVQPLGELLFSKSTPTKTRYHVCRALAEVGGSAVPLMIKKLDTDSVEVRFGLINSLGRVKSTDQATNDRITRALLEQTAKDKSVDTRRRALIALATLGEPAGKLAKEPMLALLHDVDEEETIRGEAKKTLKAVAPRRTLVD